MRDGRKLWCILPFLLTKRSKLNFSHYSLNLDLQQVYSDVRSSCQYEIKFYTKKKRKKEYELIIAMSEINLR